MNNFSNDDLARFLQHNGGLPKPAAPSTTQPTAPDIPQAQPESLAPKHRDALASQKWPLGKSAARLDSLLEWEKKALFVALIKGTKANMLREPTFAEFELLVERVEKARAFLSSVEQAIESTTSIHIEQGEFVFSGSVRRFERVADRVDAA